MVNRKYVPVKCFEGEKPRIRIDISSVNGETVEVDLRIDTGFDGSILLDNSTYAKFSLGELPESMWFRFKTLNGYLTMKTAKALVKVGEKKMETYVFTPRDFNGKNLVGLDLIKKIRLLLDDKYTCIMK
jgi:predicted aspartyl protease